MRGRRLAGPAAEVLPRAGIVLQLESERAIGLEGVVAGDRVPEEEPPKFTDEYPLIWPPLSKTTRPIAAIGLGRPAMLVDPESWNP